MYKIEQPTRSRFVTLLAIFSIVVAFVSVYQSFSLLSMQNSPEFEIVKQFVPSGLISSTQIYFEILLNCAAIIVSTALFLRLRWGRISYIVVLGIYTLWEIYSGISTYYQFSSLLTGVDPKGSLSLILFLSLVGVGINIFLIRKLSSVDIKVEFER